MARVTDDLPSTRGRATKYPWDEWCDGRAWIVTQGEDFDVDVSSFRTSLNYQARSRGMRVKTRIVSDGKLAFQFH